MVSILFFCSGVKTLKFCKLYCGFCTNNYFSLEIGKTMSDDCRLWGLFFVGFVYICFVGLNYEWLEIYAKIWVMNDFIPGGKLCLFTFYIYIVSKVYFFQESKYSIYESKRIKFLNFFKSIIGICAQMRTTSTTVFENILLILPIEMQLKYEASLIAIR